MEDEIYALRTDIQQCVAKNIPNLNTDYRTFFYNGDEMNMTNALGCFDSLEIKPNGSLMNFNGKIAKDLKFSLKELENIKKEVFTKNTYNLFSQIRENNKTFIEKENDMIEAEEQILSLLSQSEEEKKKNRPAKKYEKLLMKTLQSRILEEIGIKLNYEEHEGMLLLSGNFDSLKFTKYQLRLLVHLLEDIDMFLIAPFYEEQDDENEIILNEENDKCVAIRFAIGLYLIEEE